ncbi:MAG: DUF58 domain-containing protein [Deltaproteobacteria bacterium]|nr:DUF58 domain-containing protein [Deltaproteobacteria bacterium]
MSDRDLRGIDPELARRTASLALAARRAVEGALGGEHRSPYLGASVVFAEHREYRPGDDLRALDWRAYARLDRHFVKRFEQETNLRALLLADRSASMSYRGARALCSKAELAETLLAALALVALRQGDAVGVLPFAREPGSYLPPRARADHMEGVLAALTGDLRGADASDLGRALAEVGDRFHRRGLVALASDLLDVDDAEGAAIGAALARLRARGHDVVVFHVIDPDEIDLELGVPARFEALEGDLCIEVDPALVRARYTEHVGAFLAGWRDRAAEVGARYTLARTDVPAERALGEVLDRRRR